MKIVGRIIGIIIAILIVAWVVVIFYDYSKITKDEEPVFCIKEEVHKYDDGTVYECLGLGYRAFVYDRDSITAKEFGPFFITQKTAEDFK